MPLAEGLSEKTRVGREAKLRGQQKFGGESFSQGYYPPIYQPARKGFNKSKLVSV